MQATLERLSVQYGRLLDGFREYLILRLGEDSSLWWPGLAIKTRDPNASARPATSEDDRAAVDAILDLLDELLAESGKPDHGDRRVHRDADGCG